MPCRGYARRQYSRPPPFTPSLSSSFRRRRARVRGSLAHFFLLSTPFFPDIFAPPFDVIFHDARFSTPDFSIIFLHFIFFITDAFDAFSTTPFSPCLIFFHDVFHAFSMPDVMTRLFFFYFRFFAALMLLALSIFFLFSPFFRAMMPLFHADDFDAHLLPALRLMPTYHFACRFRAALFLFC